MKVNKYSPLLLAFLSLITGWTVFAGVKLSDGTIKTWQEFVDFLVNPTSVQVEGKISDLPDNNSLKMAYDDAVDALAAAEKDLADKKAAVDLDADPKPELVQAVADAEAKVAAADTTAAYNALAGVQKQKADYITENVTPKETAYKNAEAQLATWQQEYATYQGQATDYNNELAGYTVPISQAQTELDNAKAALAAVATTEQITTTTYPTWINTSYTNANAFEGYWDHYYETEAEEDGDKGKIYYYYKGGSMSKNLYISFGNEAPNADYTSTDVEGFYKLLTTGDTEKNIPVLLGALSNVYIYLGPEYMAAEKATSENYKLQNFAKGSEENIIALAASQLKTLRDKYATTTTKPGKVTYDDPDGSLQKAVDEAQKKLDKLKEDQATASQNLATANKNVKDTQVKIDGYTKVPAGSPEGTLSQQQQLYKDWQDAIKAADDEFDETIEQKKQELATARTNLESAEGELKTANDNLKAAQDAVTAAQAVYNQRQQDLTSATTKAQKEANAIASAAATQKLQATYQDVTLTANENAAATGVNYSGTIHGEGYVITVTGGESLFNTFNGILSSTAINGSLMKTLGANAHLTNVVRWDGTTGRIYDEEGDPTNYVNGQNGVTDPFGAIGYALRTDALFGVDFATKTVVKASAAPSPVYDLTINNFTEGSAADTQVYVQLINKGLVDSKNATVTIPTNRFAKSATSDLTGIDNVYYGANNTCDNAVIDDAVDFYCPAQIQAKAVTYERELTPGFNVVSLPFALKYSDIPNGNIDTNLSLCTYEKQGTDKFWFTRSATGIPANTPGMVYVYGNLGTVSLDLGAKTIEPTVATQIVKGATAEDGSISFGTFKKASCGEFIGESNAQYVYGLNKNNKFQAGSANATFSAFRIAIATNVKAAASAPGKKMAPGLPAEMGIGILDENGNDITGNISTGVNDVVADSFDSLEVIPGVGVLTFNSDADYGTVAVYSIDGKVAAMTKVVPGTTTVNLAKGVYIVLGKKVLVK